MANKHISIDRIEILNFKGIRRLTVDLQGKDATIAGPNGSGKSTVYDAVLWVLFGKDSRGAANFEIKPLDGHGRPVLGIETSVTLALDVNGEKYEIRRAWQEKWTTPRGQVEKVYDGCTNAFWLNDVPYSMTQYSQFVASILPEAQFRLVTSFEEFMRKNVAEKRLVLVNIASEGVDEIMAERFPKLVEALGGLSAEDARKKYKTQKGKYEDELTGIPYKLQELRDMVDAVDTSKRPSWSAALQDATKEIGEVNEALAQDPKAALRLEHRHVLQQVKDANDTAMKAYRQGLDEAAGRRNLAEATLKEARRIVSNLDGDLVSFATEIERLDKQADKLRGEYQAEYGTKFVIPATLSDTCPSCGQRIPEDQYAAAVAKASNAFSEAKAAKLGKIRGEGTAAKQRKEEVAAKLAEAKEKHGPATEAYNQAQAVFDQAVEAFNQANGGAILMPPEMKGLQAKAQELADQINAPESEQMASLRAKLRDLAEQAEACRRELSKIDGVEDTRKRIGELEARQRELGNIMVALNQKIFDVEEYTRARCNLLEDRIDEKFPTVRWRLFTETKEGNMVDACDCMILSEAGALVPYGSANTGARVNAGVEICNVLAEAYSVVAPIFVENAESVDHITRTEGQRINLHKPDPNFWHEGKGLHIRTYEKEVA